jgi:hypothetical protein
MKPSEKPRMATLTEVDALLSKWPRNDSAEPQTLELVSADALNPESSRQRNLKKLSRLLSDPQARVELNLGQYYAADVDLSNAQCDIARVQLDHGATLRDARVRLLHCPGSKNVTVINVIAEEIVLGSEMSGQFINVHAGKLRLQPRAIGNLNWAGGALGSIQMEPIPYSPRSTESVNPFAGDVVFTQVRISRARRHSRGLQWLRDVRAKLAERGNIEMAGLFRATELALARPEEPASSRIVSWIYEVGCDFGYSIGRPLTWLFSAVFALFSITFSFDALQPSNYYPAGGWHQILIEGSLEARVLRSIVYAFQCILNPLNLFSSQPLVIAKNVYMAGLCSLIGLAGILSIAFLFLSIRRRFKLSDG